MFDIKKFLSCTAAVLAVSMSVSAVSFADAVSEDTDPAVTTEISETTDTVKENTCKNHGISVFNPAFAKEDFMDRCQQMLEKKAAKENITVDELIERAKADAEARRLEVLTKKAEEQGITVDELIANIEAQKQQQEQSWKDKTHPCCPSKEDTDKPDATEEPAVTEAPAETDPEAAAATCISKHQKPECTKPAVTESPVQTEPAETEVSEEETTKVQKPDTNKTHHTQNNHASQHHTR